MDNRSMMVVKGKLIILVICVQKNAFKKAWIRWFLQIWEKHLTKLDGC